MTKRSIQLLEAKRLQLQDSLDSEKSQLERNKLGQFATPTGLALELLGHLRTHHLPKEQVRFLDPAIGTGSFYAALRTTFPKHQISAATGFEIDPHYGLPAAELWKAEGLDYRLGDFLDTQPEPSYNLIVCNPPYVRHHHLENGEKARLQGIAAENFESRLSGLAGLYCYCPPSAPMAQI